MVRHTSTISEDMRSGFDINWNWLHAVTLGAGEVLLGDMSLAGFRIAQDSEAVDCVLINTCGFVEDAKAESLQVSPLYSPAMAYVHEESRDRTVT